MPEHPPARVGRPAGAVIGAVSGALIGALFGRLWLSSTVYGLPAWRAPIEIAGWVVLGLFVVAGALVARSALRAPATPSSGRRPRRGWAVWFVAVIAVEVVLILGGQHLLGGVLGHPEWMPVWALFVVGVHFWPFAAILRVDAFHVLAGALCVTAVACALVASLMGIASLWSTLPGFGGAGVLWGFCGWMLYRMGRDARSRGA